MKKPKIITAIIAIATLGILGASGVYIYSLNKEPEAENPQVLQNAPVKGTDGQFSQLEEQYNAMKGEEYDKAFVTEMITHHQGAVSMAHLALTKAQHQELKDMARNIIDAQMQEIRDMETWKKEWGYAATGQQNAGGMAGMDHGDGKMEQMMAEMTNELSAKDGDEFDKVFLRAMIEHHQSAVAMARPGVTNAQHQELRDLTKAIVVGQSREISQMQQWQKSWGYEG